MLTEEEAKTKWCPFVRLTRAGTGSIVNNRGKWSDNINRCIASQCMAWRIGKEKAKPQRAGYPTEYENTGFCGLAGKP